MKKVLLVVAVVAMMGLSANAQNAKKAFNIGINGGIPVFFDSHKNYSTGFEFEINRIVPVTKNFQAGLGVSYQHFMAKDITVDGKKVKGKSTYTLPVSAVARYNFTPNFVAGVDVGYAFRLSKDTKGGVYFRPMVGYKFTDRVMVQAFLSGTPDRKMAGVGVVFSL